MCAKGPRVEGFVLSLMLLGVDGLVYVPIISPEPLSPSVVNWSLQSNEPKHFLPISWLFCIFYYSSRRVTDTISFFHIYLPEFAFLITPSIITFILSLPWIFVTIKMPHQFTFSAAFDITLNDCIFLHIYSMLMLIIYMLVLLLLIFQHIIFQGPRISLRMID